MIDKNGKPVEFFMKEEIISYLQKTHPKGVFVKKDFESCLILPKKMELRRAQELLKEVEQLNSKLYYVVEDNTVTKMTKEELKSYLTSFLQQKRGKHAKKELEKLSNADYIKELLNYTMEHNMSIYDYYLKFASFMEGTRKMNVPEFEKQNPFLQEEDYKLLMYHKGVSSYFASTMSKLIKFNIQNEMSKRNEKKEIEKEKNTSNQPVQKKRELIIKDSIDDEKIESHKTLSEIDQEKIKQKKQETKEEDNKVEEKETKKTNSSKKNFVITSINIKRLKKLKGFRLKRKEKAGQIILKSFNKESQIVLKKRTIDNINFKIKNGNYVNIVEYMNDLKKNLPENSGISFQIEQQEYDYQSIMNGILHKCRKEGAIRFGKEYKGKVLKTYEDFEAMYDDSEEGLYMGKKLKKGLYVRKDILEDLLHEMQFKVYEKDSKKIETKNR